MKNRCIQINLYLILLRCKMVQEYMKMMIWEVFRTYLP